MRVHPVLSSRVLTATSARLMTPTFPPTAVILGVMTRSEARSRLRVASHAGRRLASPAAAAASVAFLRAFHSASLRTFRSLLRGSLSFPSTFHFSLRGACGWTRAALVISSISDTGSLGRFPSFLIPLRSHHRRLASVIALHSAGETGVSQAMRRQEGLGIGLKCPAGSSGLAQFPQRIALGILGRFIVFLLDLLPTWPSTPTARATPPTE